MAAFTQKDVDQLGDFLKVHDRGGFYALWYKVTGSEEALLQGQISTFSGVPGGIALSANLILQNQLGDAYPGIFVLSQAVAQSAYDLLLGNENDLTQSLTIKEGYDPGAAYVGGLQGAFYPAPSDDDLYASAQAAWSNAKVSNLFPGNFFLGDPENPPIGSPHPLGQPFQNIDPNFQKISPGTDAVIASITFNAPGLFGKEISDFNGLPGYQTVAVTCDVTGKTIYDELDPSGKTVYVGPDGLPGILGNIASMTIGSFGNRYNPDYVQFRQNESQDGSPSVFNEKNFQELITRPFQPLYGIFGDYTSSGPLLGNGGGGTTSADRIYGSPGADVFDGKGAPTGSTDFELGNGGDDKFVFNAGYGNVKISESAGFGAASSAALMLGTGISIASLSLSVDIDGNLHITDGVSGDQVTVAEEFVSGYIDVQHGIEEVVFADGTTLNRQQIVTLLTAGTSGADRLYGLYTGVSTFDGLGAPIGTQDYEQGGGSIEFGSGNGGRDTFVFDPGYGHLEIQESAYLSSPATLQLGSGIASASLRASNDSAGDILLTDGISGDRVQIDGMAGSSEAGVGQVKFADGTVMTRQQILDLAGAGTVGADKLYALRSGETLNGLGAPAGSQDYEQGFGLNDTFIFNPGYGHLEILVDGGSNPTSGATLLLGPGIDLSNLVVSRDVTGNMLLMDGVAGDRIQIDYEGTYFSYDYNTGTPGGIVGIDQFLLADGTTLTPAQLFALSTTGSAGADIIYGPTVGETFDGKGAPAGAQDYVQGRGGADTFVFNAGYGHLEINEDASYKGNTSTLQLGSGITAAQLHVSSNQDGDVFLTDGTDGDEIRVDSQFKSGYQASPEYGIFQVQLADGTTLGRQDLLKLISSADLPKPLIDVNGGVLHLQATDATPLSPFSLVSVTDTVVDAMLAATIVLSDGNGQPTDATGVLSGAGVVQTGIGTYSVSGASQSDLAAELANIQFSPGPRQSAGAPQTTTNINLTILDDLGATATSQTATIISAPAGLALVISGTVSDQMDVGSYSFGPLSNVEITDAAQGTSEHITITLTDEQGVATDANGTLDAYGFTQTGVGTYTINPEAASHANYYLPYVQFNPTAGQASPDHPIKTGISLVVTNDQGQTSTDVNTSVIVSVTAPSNPPPVITGVLSRQTVGSGLAMSPLAAVRVTDMGQWNYVGDSATLVLTDAQGVATDANGRLSGIGLTKNGVGTYSFGAASPGALSGELATVIFTPTSGTASSGQAVTTGLALTVTSISAAVATDSATTIVAMAVNDAPSISGTLPIGGGADNMQTHPFSMTVITDPDFGATETAVLTLTDAQGVATDANGVLSGAGLSKAGVGTYAFASAAPAALTTELQAVLFTPTLNQVAPGQTVTTGMTLAVTDDQGAVATDKATTVVATALTLTGGAVDPGPVTRAGQVTVGHGQAVDLATLVAGLVEPGLPGDTETVMAVGAARGTASLGSAGAVSYVAPADGMDTVTYTVADQLGNAATGTVAVTVDPGPAIMASASDRVGHYQLAEVGTVAAGLPGDTLILTTTSGGRGTLDLTDGILTYYAPGFGGGPDSIGYTITDQLGDSVAGTVALLVDGGPTAAAGALTVGHGQAVDLTSLIAGLVTPGLAGDAFPYEDVWAERGQATIDAKGVISYVAPALGDDVVHYLVVDQLGEAAFGTVAVTNPSQPGDTDTLVLNLSEDAGQGDAQFTATLDGVQLGAPQAVTALHEDGQSQAFAFTGNFGAGPHQVGISFVNPAPGGSGLDRNLHVDSITLDGTANPADTALLNGSGTQAFYVAGLPFAPPAATAADPDVLVLHMSEDAYQGDAQFTVAVDGNQVGGTQTVWASAALQQVQDFGFGANFGAGTHDLAVTFLNHDAGGPYDSRNLYVASADLNGTHYADANGALYSNGTLHFQVGAPVG